MKKQIALILAAAPLLSLSATSASAQAYVGGGLGVAHHRVDCDGWDCDRSPTGFKLYGGYKFTQFFAVEGSYTDFGAAKQTDPLDTRSKFNTSLTSFGLGGAAFYDFGSRLSGVARLGISSNRSNVKASYDDFSVQAKDKEWKPYFGLGVGVRVAPRTTVEFNADFTRYEFDGVSYAARLLTLGVRQSF